MISIYVVKQVPCQDQPAYLTHERLRSIGCSRWMAAKEFRHEYTERIHAELDAKTFGGKVFRLKRPVMYSLGLGALTVAQRRTVTTVIRQFLDDARHERQMRPTREISVSDAAALLNVHRSSIEQAVQSGRIRVSRCIGKKGGRKLLDLGSVQSYRVNRRMSESIRRKISDQKDTPEPSESVVSAALQPAEVC